MKARSHILRCDALVVALLALFIWAMPRSARAADPLAGPPLQLQSHAVRQLTLQTPTNDLRLSIDSLPDAHPIRWWGLDPLPWEVRDRALHPRSHLLGFQDSHLVVTPVPLSTRELNELRVTSDPHTWFLLAFGYRTLF